MSTDVNWRENQGLDRRAAWLMADADNFRRAWDQGYRLSVAERRLLWFLSEGEPRTLREISENLNLEQSTVNRQVNGALAAGLLRRQRQKGKSASHIAPTDEGMRIFNSDISRGLEAYEGALAKMGEEDASLFVDLLERFVHAYGRVIQDKIQASARFGD